MARVFKVNTSRKSHNCGKGHEIPKGEGYYWAAPGYHAPKKFRCFRHPFRPSELTTSAASAPMAAVEAFEDQIAARFESFEDLEAAWGDLLSEVEAYRDERQEAFDAWENGNSMLEEYLETAEAAYSELESHQLEEPDEEWDIDQQSDHISDQADEALSVAQGLEF